MDNKLVELGGMSVPAPSFEAQPRGVPLVFLDIDGVLFIPSRSMDMGAFGRMLVQVVAASGAELVLSSTWRWDWCKHVGRNQNGVTDWLRLLKDPVIRMATGDAPGHAEEQRALEITSWFGGPGHRRLPWIAIDDLDLAHTAVGDRLDGHFVRTDSKEGFTPAHAALALDLLAKQGVRIDESALGQELRDVLMHLRSRTLRTTFVSTCRGA